MKQTTISEADGLPLDWRQDPIVRIENVLLPVLSGVPSALLQRLQGQRAAKKETRLARALDAFAASCVAGFSDYLEEAGFELDDADTLKAQQAGEEIRAFSFAFRGDATDAYALSDRFTNTTEPAAVAALNIMRRVFLTGVLTRQAEHAGRADAAMAELSRLSRSIQFVAINASIEAARSGASGRAFALIAAEIRELAKSARDVITRSSI